MLAMSLYETIRNLGLAAETEITNITLNYIIAHPEEKDLYLNAIKVAINTQYSAPEGYEFSSDWQASNVYSGDHGLQYVEFKNETTHQIVIFAIGQQTDGTEAQRDQDYTTQPLLHDQAPLTAFELARQYELVQAANQGFEVILAGHSGGAVDAKLAGAILQYQGESVEVASYGGWGVGSILNNLNFEANPLNLQLDESMFVNFYNSGDGLILSRAGAIDDFGHQFYSPVTDVNSMVSSVLNWYSPIQLPNSNVNHELGNLDFSTLTSFWQPPILTSPIPFLGSIPTSQLIQSQFIAAENILGAIGNNTVEGGTGNDVLVGSRDSVGVQYHDVIYGYEGNDILFGDKGNDTLIGGAGNDTYYGSTGEDTILIRQGEGLDVIRNTFSSNDTLQFTGLTGTTFNRSDIQSISAIGGTIGGQSFGDLMIEFDENNKVLIEGQFDSSKPHPGVESIKFDDGDLIVGTLGDDDGMTIYSTSGNDLIYTFDGDDILEGGEGNDTLHGGAGNDIYHFAIGDGQDVIYNSSGDDVIKFGLGIQEEQVSTQISGNDLILNILDESLVEIVAQITIKDYYLSGHQVGWTFDSAGIFDDTITGGQGNDGLQLGAIIENFPSITSVHGGVGNDLVYGFGGNDILIDDAVSASSKNGLHRLVASNEGGNDKLYAGDGNDIIYSFHGQDTIYGGDGADAILYSHNSFDGSPEHTVLAFGGEGNDTFTTIDDVAIATPSNDTLSGGNGADALFGNYGNDSLIGGTGNDRLAGGRGADTYYYGLGDGDDQLFEEVFIGWAPTSEESDADGRFYQWYSNPHSYSVSSIDGLGDVSTIDGSIPYTPTADDSNDTLEFGPGITWENLQFQAQSRNDLWSWYPYWPKAAQDLQITFNNQSGSVYKDTNHHCLHGHNSGWHYKISKINTHFAY